MLEDLMKSKYEFVMCEIKRVEYKLTTFDAMWGFDLDAEEAIKEYKLIANIVHSLKELSPEEKEELLKIIDTKIEEAPQKEKESREEIEREDREHSEAWEKAKERYKKSSIWSKAKYILKGQTPRKLVAKHPNFAETPNIPTSSIKELYGGNHDR